MEITGKRSIAGHTSISLDRHGVWGFWPNIPNQLITDPGLLRYTEYADVYPLQQDIIEFTIDETAYAQILKLIDEWYYKPPVYIVPFIDCVTFINLVCKIAGIKYNPLALFPMNAIQEIRWLNERSGR
jgi:hypothetical protein